MKNEIFLKEYQHVFKKDFYNLDNIYQDQIEKYNLEINFINKIEKKKKILKII